MNFKKRTFPSMGFEPSISNFFQSFFLCLSIFLKKKVIFDWELLMKTSLDLASLMTIILCVELISKTLAVNTHVTLLYTC